MAYLTQYSGSVPVIKFNIDQSVMTIGQDLEMDICVPEDGISNNHASLEAVKNDDSYRFIVKSREDEPLISLNGETVAVAELQDGDWIIIGDVEFQFTDDGIYEIVQVEIPKVAEVGETHLEIVKNQPEESSPHDQPEESSPHELVQDIHVEAEPLAADSMDDDHRFSRRLNFF